MRLPVLARCLLAAATAVPGVARAGEQATKLSAFPGAEGFGCQTPGGRGGRVIRVTNLKNSGPGSLQWACNQKGPRIVVFAVSGVIEGDLTIKHGQVTIAGQTAPGGGITINGMLSTAYRKEDFVRDVVVRFLRVRGRPGGGAQGDAIQFSIVDNAVLDHLSCSWAEDETIDIFSRATNISIQWCTLEESSLEGHAKGRHNYGLIAGSNSKRISIHHNLFAHHFRRNPAVGNGPVDFRNNVVYNFRDGWSHEGNYRGTPGFNIVGNYYKAGPNAPKITIFAFEPRVPYHVRDNFVEGAGTIGDPWKQTHALSRPYSSWVGGGRGVPQKKETPVPRVTTHRPQEAYRLILATAGCLPRDAVTERTISETRKGTGKWGRHEPKGGLMANLRPGRPPQDSDRDGMPDEWERKHGLDPNNPRDVNGLVPRGVSQGDRHAGYTYIEFYINELADELVRMSRSRAQR
jgi:pectate lyase